jgi:hypothetical protein
MLSPAWSEDFMRTTAIYLALLLTFTATARSQIKFDFTSFDYPGAATTAAYGTNNTGFIVGANAVTQSAHGFIRLPNGTFRELMYPGSDYTVASGINDSNQVVGYYSFADGSGGAFLFVPPDQFTTLNYPGAPGTVAIGINYGGQIVGYWVNGQGGIFGFSYVNGTFTSIVHPGATETEATGVNSAGNIVGWWRNTDVVEGFLLPSASSQNYYDFQYEGGTTAFAVNDHKQVVGQYSFDNSAAGFGAEPLQNQYMTIDYPNSEATGVTGIANSGRIVGYYIDFNDNRHGFFAVPTN